MGRVLGVLPVVRTGVLCQNLLERQSTVVGRALGVLPVLHAGVPCQNLLESQRSNAVIRVLRVLGVLLVVHIRIPCQNLLGSHTVAPCQTLLGGIRQNKLESQALIQHRRSGFVGVIQATLIDRVNRTVESLDMIVLQSCWCVVCGFPGVQVLVHPKIPCQNLLESQGGEG